MSSDGEDWDHVQFPEEPTVTTSETTESEKSATVTSNVSSVADSVANQLMQELLEENRALKAENNKLLNRCLVTEKYRQEEIRKHSLAMAKMCDRVMLDFDEYIASDQKIDGDYRNTDFIAPIILLFSILSLFIALVLKITDAEKP